MYPDSRFQIPERPGPDRSGTGIPGRDEVRQAVPLGVDSHLGRDSVRAGTGRIWGQVFNLGSSDDECGLSNIGQGG